MMGERPKMAGLGLVVLFLLGGLSNAWGADGVEATPTTEETTSIESGFQRVYDELTKTDPAAAELMKQEFEAYQRGDLEVSHMDPEEAKKEFEKGYQELVSKGETEEAQKLKENFDKFQEWEKGGRVGSPPIDFERAGESYDHMSDEAKAELAEKWGEWEKSGQIGPAPIDFDTGHENFEIPTPGETPFDHPTGESSPISEFDKGEYEHSMQDYGGMEHDGSEQTTVEVERPEMESTQEMTYEREMNMEPTYERETNLEPEKTYEHEREYQYDMPDKEQEYQPQPH